jgi:hypothetical protein
MMSWYRETKAHYTIEVCTHRKPHVRCPKRKMLFESKVTASRMDRLVECLMMMKQYGQVVVSRNEAKERDIYGGKPGRVVKKDQPCEACGGEGTVWINKKVSDTEGSAYAENCTACGGGGKS